MNHKELRIGRQKIITTVDSIYEGYEFPLVNLSIHEDDENRFYGTSLEDIEGIPLTEEILLKAGCIKGHKKNFYWREHLLFEIFNVSALENGFKLIAGRLTKNAIIAISKEIEYIHQLQNIHFVLTGTELQINL